MSEIGHLTMVDVEIRYGRRLVVRAPFIEVSRSTPTAIVGASGSGKSSLLRCMTGLQRPAQGHVLIDDVDLATLSPSRLARRRRDLFGLVLQGGSLVPSLSALENVQVALDLRHLPRSRSTARASLSRLGLDHVADRRPDQLSGGEQQRVAFARVLAQQAPFVALDEPTSSLDAENRAQVIEGISTMIAEGSGVIAVTHDLDLAARFHALVTIHSGRAAEFSGPHSVPDIRDRIEGRR